MVTPWVWIELTILGSAVFFAFVIGYAVGHNAGYEERRVSDGR